MAQALGNFEHQHGHQQDVTSPRTWSYPSAGQQSSKSPWPSQPANPGYSTMHHWANTNLGHHRTFSQACQELVIPTIRLMLDLGTLALQPLTPKHSSAHWASTSPGSPLLQGTAPCHLMTQTHHPGAGSLCTMKGLAATGPRDKPYLPNHLQYSAHQSRRTHLAHIGSIPKVYSSGDQKGVHFGIA